MLEKRVKSGLAVTPRHLKLCDDNLRRAGVGSRNDFAEQAIEFYCSHLISRELSAMGGKSQVPMERFETLSRALGTGQYKLSVEVATMTRILARRAPAGSGTVSRRMTARASSRTTTRRTTISRKSK